MHSSQPWSSGKSSGDMLPNTAIAGLNIPSIPGLSVEQVTAIMTAVQIAMDQSFDQHFGPVQHSPPTPPPTQPISLAKKKRNQRTRNQYKKKAKAQAQRVTMVQVQEVEHSYGQEVDHLDVQISVEKASKHEAFVKSVAWNGIPTMATSPHAVIPYVGMTSLNGMIRFEVIWRPRMGVG